MDANKTKVHPNPREKSNMLAVLFWTWTYGIFKTGYRKILGPDDLFEPLKNDRSDVLGDRLEKEWFLELEKKRETKAQPSFLAAIVRCFRWEFLLYGVLHAFNEFILRLGTPILLGRLLRYFRENSGTTYHEALIYAGGICLAIGINAITINQSVFGTNNIGSRIRIAVCSVIYRKALRLSTTAFGDTAPGKVVNLIANDVSRFDYVITLMNHMWSAPLAALIIGYFLYKEAGYVGMVGIVVVFLVVSIQSYTGKLSSIFRLRIAIKIDERVRLMDEIISGVQVIKMYAWEKPFCVLVAMARKLELKAIQKLFWILIIFMTFELFTTRAAIYCTLIGMMLCNQQLTAERVFMFSSFFNIISQTMSGLFVRGVTEVAGCLIAIQRLQNFLMYDEVGTTKQSTCPENLKKPIDNLIAEKKLLTPQICNMKDTHDIIYESEDEEKIIDETTKMLNLANLIKHDVNCNINAENWAVKIINASAKWELRNQANTLNKVTIKLERGKLYVVIGAVGSGKSSLISAILGELQLIEGSITVQGGLSYAAQEAWVFGSTIRQNIIFGQPYDRQRYQKVVKVCALLSDFKQFPQGDQTIVGERGSSLSGGQKARINLARAVYRQADIYILDDPLSAVDTHVGKHLFEECLERYLSGKTRIVATHQLQHIKDVDGIILIDHGFTRIFSSYVDLLAQCPEYASLLASDSANETEESFSERSTMRRRTKSSISNRSKASEASGIDTDVEDDDDNYVDFDTIEATSRGVIQGSILLKYFRSGGSWVLIIAVGLFFILTQCFTSGTDYFLSVLVNEEESRYKDFIADTNYTLITNSTNDIKIYDMTPALPYIYVYTSLILLIFIIGITRSYLFFHLCIRNSQSLHDRSFGALIRTSMRFFDTNPSGRILNRFSKDLSAIDEQLPKALLDSGQIIAMMFASLIIVCIVNPIFIVSTVIIVFVFYWIRKIYLKTSKNVKRLEGMMRSPVFTHLNTTINGLSTIRACKAQEILKEEFDVLQDRHSSSWYMYLSTSMAFAFSSDVFCFMFITVITFSFLLLDFGISGAKVGLAISTVLAITRKIQFGMRQGAEVTNQMMSVERVLEYSLLPPEDNVFEEKLIKQDKQKKDMLIFSRAIHAPQNWPTEGSIKFQNVYLRYAEEEAPVIKGLELTIKPKEKVGIVGRTGAGKSSLISALFRLAKINGIINIDGVNTGSIYLEDLRRKISIIPQDPVLFSGSLRKNLDPFNEFEDSLLWAVLEEVELKETFSGSNGLESRVLDRGTNFSAGQRQLVCLARAILRNNKILMLDEATANVDPHTDSLIQRTIRKKFADCTVLTVAHRLNTIMDSDKVLVMDKGRMIEFDHPYILLKNDFGQFTSLVKETGRSMSEQLTRIAKQAYDNKQCESTS